MMSKKILQNSTFSAFVTMVFLGGPSSNIVNAMNSENFSPIPSSNRRGITRIKDESFPAAAEKMTRISCLKTIHEVDEDEEEMQDKRMANNDRKTKVSLKKTSGSSSSTI